MNVFSKKVKNVGAVVVAGVTGVVVSCSSAFAAFALPEMPKADIETAGVAVAGLVVAGVLIGAVLKMVRKAG